MSPATHAGNHTGLAFERARPAPSSNTQHQQTTTHPDDQASRLRALVEADAFDQLQPQPDHETDLIIDTDLETDLDDTNPAIQPTQPPGRNTLATYNITPRTCKRIAIVSGKGGVGKSNVAVNLAIAFASTGRRIALVDADLGTANADVLCGLLPTARLEHALPELDSFDGATQSLQDIAINAPGGFQLIPGSAGLGRIADLDPQHRHRLLRDVESLEHNREAILIDSSAGIGAPAIMFATWADAVVLVCTPEPTAMADAYAMLKAMARSVHQSTANANAASTQGFYANSISANITSLGTRIAVVVNQVPGDNEARAAYRRIAGVCDRFLGFRPVFMGWIPSDRDVPASVIARKPLLINKPRSKAATHIRQLADRLAEQIPLPKPPQPSTVPNPASAQRQHTTQGTPIAIDPISDAVRGLPNHPTTAPETPAARRSIFSGLLSPFSRRNPCAPAQDLTR